MIENIIVGKDKALGVYIDGVKVWGKVIPVEPPVIPEPEKPPVIVIPDPVPNPANFRDEYLGDSLITKEELREWKRRVKNRKPFVTANDYAPGSYADYERIENDKNAYVKNGVMKFDYSSNHLNSNGSVIIDTSNKIVSYSLSNSHNAWMSAGQWNLINDSSPKSCLTDLLACISTSYNGSRRDRLPKSGNYYGDINPLFELPIFVTRYMQVYDLLLAAESLGLVTITSAQKSKINAYWAGWLDWFMWCTHTQFIKYCGKQVNGQYEVDILDDPADWTLTNTANSSMWPAYHGQTEPILSFSANRNNRTSAISSAVGHLAAHLIGTEYDAQAKEGIKLFKKYVKSYVVYGIYPDGTFMEFNRSHKGNTHLGLFYISNTLGCMNMSIDAILRKTNDKELLTYTTRKDRNKSQLLNFDKSWKWVCDRYLDYLDGTRTNVYNKDYMNVPVEDRPKMRFDGYSETTSRRVERAIYFDNINKYYKDPRWERIIDYSHPGTHPKPGFLPIKGNPDTHWHGVSAQQLVPLFSYFKVPAPKHFS